MFFGSTLQCLSHKVQVQAQSQTLSNSPLRNVWVYQSASAHHTFIVFANEFRSRVFENLLVSLGQVYPNQND